MLQEHKKKYIAPDGTTITYYLHRCQDADTTLVMLHGLASNHTRWSEFVNNTELAQHLNLLRIDLRGHGESMTWRRFSHGMWCNDLFAICRQESIGKLILAGHSLGAQLALNFTVRHPSIVCGLLLIDPTFPTNLKGKLSLARRLRYLLLAGIFLTRIWNSFDLHKKSFPIRDLHELDLKTRAYLTENKDQQIENLYTKPSADLKYMPRVNYLQDVHETVRPLPAITEIQCPINILLSKGSSIVALGDINSHFHPNTSITVTEIDANHWPLTEKPLQTRQSIDEWCLKLIS